MDLLALTVETAKANDLQPYDYLYYVIRELQYADTVEKLEALMPWNLKNKIDVVNQES